MARYEITNEPAAIDFECNNDFRRRRLQNAKNLLMLEFGEVPFDRQRGFDARLYDLPITELEERLLPELDRALLWEPDVDVVSATCQQVDGGVLIRCVVEVRGT